jgi:hypothetical protein
MTAFNTAFTFLRDSVIQKNAPTVEQMRQFVLANENHPDPAMRAKVDEIYQHLTSMMSGRESLQPEMPDVHGIEAARREAMARRSFEAAPPMAQMDGEGESSMRMTPGGQMAPVPVQRMPRVDATRPANPFKGERGQMQKAERVERRERRTQPGENSMLTPEQAEDEEIGEQRAGGIRSLPQYMRPMNRAPPRPAEPDTNEPPNPFPMKRKGSPMDIAFAMLKSQYRYPDPQPHEEAIDPNEMLRRIEADREAQRMGMEVGMPDPRVRDVHHIDEANTDRLTPEELSEVEEILMRNHATGQPFNPFKGERGRAYYSEPGAMNNLAQVFPNMNPRQEG